jgi:hypothetical protein
MNDFDKLIVCSPWRLSAFFKQSLSYILWGDSKTTMYHLDIAYIYSGYKCVFDIPYYYTRYKILTFTHNHSQGD